MTIFPGIILAHDGNGVRIKTTKRVDLAKNRSGFVGAVATATPDAAKKLARVLERAFVKPGSGGMISIAQAKDALNRCRRFGLQLIGSAMAPEPKAKAFAPMVEDRYVPDPSMSRAELLHQIQQNPERRWVGHVKREVSMTTLIGGLARVKGRTEAQNKGAEHFRRVAEQSMLGGAKALDYARPAVDTSGQSADAIAEANADSRREYDNASRRLDKCGLRVVAELMIVKGQSAREVAETLGVGNGGTARDKITTMVLRAADELADEFGYSGIGRTGRLSASWSDGSKAVIKRDEAA